MFSDETLLDQAGTVAIVLGGIVLLGGFSLLGSASIETILSFAELGSKLIGLGVAAIVGGGAVKAFLRE